MIVTPYSMTATPTAILYTGALPIFADIEPDTYGLDPKSVEKNINKNTKGIIVVNLFGHPARLPELQKIAKKNNLFLIEDNAQAPGALIDGKLTGNAIRVPTPNVSLAILSLQLNKKVNVNDVNGAKT